MIENINTFTVTTGHQLSLFTGPLYFLYKIISTINLSEELKLKYPDFNFIPIYWMASEDHDFEEIRSFSYNAKNIIWNSDQKGEVGKFSTYNLKSTLDIFSKLLPIFCIKRKINFSTVFNFTPEKPIERAFTFNSNINFTIDKSISFPAPQA